MTISLCMIVRDEEAVLARCLDSVREAADEIIILDTGSRDRTKEIAAAYTKNVYDFAWVDDFSAARNAAFSRAAMDYQMWLDADDVLPPGELEKLLRLKQTLPGDVDIVTMRYITHFDAQGRPIFTSRRERLLRREGGFLWQDPVHECIPLRGNILHSDILIEHRQPPREGSSGRNLRIYRALAQGGADLTPRQQYYFARELRDHGHFGEASGWFLAFLEGGKGWVEDEVAACLALGQCKRALGEADEALSAFLRGLGYAGPRPELLCEIGYCYKERGHFAVAADWFRAAAAVRPPDTGGFRQPDYEGYIPHLELCVCLYHMGDVQGAIEHNEAAGAYMPGSPAVEANRRFFEALG